MSTRVRRRPDRLHRSRPCAELLPERDPARRGPPNCGSGFQFNASRSVFWLGAGFPHDASSQRRKRRKSIFESFLILSLARTRASGAASDALIRLIRPNSASPSTDASNTAANTLSTRCCVRATSTTDPKPCAADELADDRADHRQSRGHAQSRQDLRQCRGKPQFHTA